MDKMCNKSELENVNRTGSSVDERLVNPKRCESPVFKCVNHNKPIRVARSNSSDSDYHFSQTIKNRTCSKYENETSESILPFSPVLSPIPISSVPFQPPSTVAKGAIGEKSRNNNKELKTCSAFESLGMTDKDISWVSSMASPPPLQVPGTGFNTVEKATFFPEEKFQNIQPRALFSPTLDEDSGCKPLMFSSESEDDEPYQSNIRLSDVCATLKQLEVKSLDQKTPEKKVLPTSPVIKTKNKKESSRKKAKEILVISPEPNDKYEFSVGKNFENEKGPSDSNFIEDDSFQSISFTCIDELCKTLVNLTDPSTVPETTKCDNTLVAVSESMSSYPVSKYFYNSKTKTDIYAVSSMENLHSYAQALEEGDVNLPQGKRLEKALMDEGIVRFNALEKDSNATKRLHSELMDEEEGTIEKKLKISDEASSWNAMKKYLTESQLNVSDSEIFKTVENLEKTLASQDSKEGGSQGFKILEDMNDADKEIISSGLVSGADVKNKPSTSSHFVLRDLFLEPEKATLMGFLTASGSKVSISEKALMKAKEVFKSCDEVAEKSEGAAIICREGFYTGAGQRIQISRDALEKAKALMSECEENSTSNLEVGSSKIIKVSPEALEKAKNLMSGDESPTRRKKFTSKGSTIRVSPEALEKAKALISDEKASEVASKWMKGFLTGSGKTIQVSSQALEKAKSLLSKCNEISGGNSKILSPELDKKIKVSPEAFLKAKALMSDESEVRSKWTKGFSTGSGKTIRVSSQALEKAKSLLSECGERGAADFKSFSPESGKKIQVSSEALEKGKALMSESDSMLKDRQAFYGSSNLNRNLTPGFIGESSGEVKFSGFMTGLGNRVKVSKEAVEKIKAECDSVGAPTVSDNFEVPFEGFSTAAGSKVTVSGTALAKARELLARWDQDQSEARENFESSTLKHSKNETESLKKPPATSSVAEIEPGTARSNEGDSEEIVPSWLHVYTTSPSLASDRVDSSPVASRDDGKSYRPGREYIIKSPVLGSSDRFYKKIKRRKLQFKVEGSEVPEADPSGFVVPYKSSGKKPSVKRTCTNFSMDFSAPFKRTKSLEEVKSSEGESLDVEEERAKARARQEKAAREKEKAKPQTGSHLSRKRSEKQVKWMEAVGGASPKMHSEEFLKSMGVREGVLRVDVTNALGFKFSGPEYFGPSCVSNTAGFPVGDGCLLIPDGGNDFGVEEFKRAFAAAPGVQPNLIPEGWLDNHYKWVVWKLAHYERSFPRHFGGRTLTPHNVMLQLKYRYDREIDRSERSALKKILERDDTSVRRMVLCVCGIEKTRKGSSSSDYELILTDGWYSCPAQTDPAMTRLIEEGKLSAGTKLVTQGAALVNCDQGISPLEINEDVYLRISTNSTRRIRWDAKLGFQKNPENFSISLASILPQGGPISRLDVIIVRVYPMLYMEKTSDGHHVTRNLRSEEKADSEYRKIQEKRMETICSDIQAEMQKSGKRRPEKKLNKKSLLEIEQAEDLCQLMENSSDPSALEELMTATQRQLLQNFHLKESDRLAREISQKIEEKLKKEKLNKRNVSEFLKVKVVDLRKPDYNNPAVLSVWNPKEEVLRLFSEGKAVSLTNVSLPNSSRIFKPMQINTTRQSQYLEISRSIKYPARQVTRLNEVSSKICPVFEEVDVVGVIALIRDASYGSRFYQTVYLTDLDFNFIGIVFWGSCKDYGWENVLTLRSIVACSNLQWKKSYTSQEVPSLSVNENSVFTENPKRSHLREELERLKKQMPEDLNTFFSKCEEELTIKLEDSKRRANASRNSSANDSVPKLRRVDGFGSKPAASSTPIKPFSAGLSSGEAEPSPIQKRIEKLQCYGEPPPLLPLFVANNARKFKRKT